MRKRGSRALSSNVKCKYRLLYSSFRLHLQNMLKIRYIRIEHSSENQFVHINVLRAHYTSSSFVWLIVRTLHAPMLATKAPTKLHSPFVTSTWNGLQRKIDLLNIKSTMDCFNLSKFSDHICTHAHDHICGINKARQLILHHLFCAVARSWHVYVCESEKKESVHICPGINQARNYWILSRACGASKLNDGFRMNPLINGTVNVLRKRCTTSTASMGCWLTIMMTTVNVSFIRPSHDLMLITFQC